jgi:hypothetical protein
MYLLSGENETDGLFGSDFKTVNFVAVGILGYALFCMCG